MPSPPITLGFTFGDWTPPPALRRLAGTSLAWVGDVGDRSVTLLISEFRKPTIEALLRSLVAEAQDFEDAVWQVLVGIWLDTAEGVQLAMLGALLDLPNAGWSDDTYRVYLKAQILVLRTEGSWPHLLKILEAIGVTVSLTTIDEPGMAAMRVSLGELLGAEVLPADVYRLLVAAKPSGVRFSLEFPTAEIADAFTWADGDVDQADTRRGWPTDDADFVDGGYWNGELVTTEAA